MKIRFRCSCGQSYTVDEQLAGKKVKCKSCGVAVRVPGGREDEPAAAARPDHPPQPARSRSAVVTASAASASPAAPARPATASQRNGSSGRGGDARAKPRRQPMAHNRYEAISDRRHGGSNNMTFVVGGAFAIAVIAVVIVAVIMLATPEKKPPTPNTPPTRTTAIDQVPITPPKPADAKPPATSPGDTAAKDPSTDTAAPTTPAPDVEDVEVAYGEMQAGPWELRVSSIELLETFTCTAAAVMQAAGGKPFVVKPTRAGYKLAVVSLSAVPKRAYSAEELASINKLPILAQGTRKLEESELMLVSEHLTLACVDPDTKARKALPPLLLYPEQADAGIAISGSNNAAYNSFAVFADEAIDLVAVYEVNPEDHFLLLIARPTPQTIPTPAYRLNISPAGALSSAGFADLVKFDPSLAPGERRARPADAPAEEPTPPAETTPPADAPEPPTEPAEPATEPSEPTEPAEPSDAGDGN